MTQYTKNKSVSSSPRNMKLYFRILDCMSDGMFHFMKRRTRVRSLVIKTNYACCDRRGFATVYTHMDIWFTAFDVARNIHIILIRITLPLTQYLLNILLFIVIYIHLMRAHTKEHSIFHTTSEHIHLQISSKSELLAKLRELSGQTALRA